MPFPSLSLYTLKSSGPGGLTRLRAPQLQPRSLRSHSLPTRVLKRARNANIWEESLSNGLPSRRRSITSAQCRLPADALLASLRPCFSFTCEGAASLPPSRCSRLVRWSRSCAEFEAGSGVPSSTTGSLTATRSTLESRSHESMLRQPYRCQILGSCPRVPLGPARWRRWPASTTQALPLVRFGLPLPHTRLPS